MSNYGKSSANEILGVPTDATVDQIKTAFHKASKIHHPDKGGTAAMFAIVNQAYEEMLESAKHPKSSSSFKNPTVHKSPEPKSEDLYQTVDETKKEKRLGFLATALAIILPPFVFVISALRADKPIVDSVFFSLFQIHLPYYVMPLKNDSIWHGPFKTIFLAISLALTVCVWFFVITRDATRRLYVSEVLFCVVVFLIIDSRQAALAYNNPTIPGLLRYAFVMILAISAYFALNGVLNGYAQSEVHAKVKASGQSAGRGSVLYVFYLMALVFSLRRKIVIYLLLLILGYFILYLLIPILLPFFLLWLIIWSFVITKTPKKPK